MRRSRCAGRQARRSDGKLPPHVMVYFAMALALFADDDYEEVAGPGGGVAGPVGLLGSGVVGRRRRVGSPRPGSGWASSRCKEVFERVAGPVADELTRGAWLGPWRLVAIDGFEWDVPDTAGERRRSSATPAPAAHAVGVPEGAGGDPGRVRLARGGRPRRSAGIATAGEQSLARELYPRLEPGRLLTRRPQLLRLRRLVRRRRHRRGACCGGSKASIDAAGGAHARRRLLPDGAGRPRRSAHRARAALGWPPPAPARTSTPARPGRCGSSSTRCPTATATADGS